MAIKPHGGKLISRLCSPEEKGELLARARELPQSLLSKRGISDLELLATGVYSPLQGFMTSEAYRSVVKTMRLPNGLPWALPIVHAVPKDFADGLGEGDEIALIDSEGAVLGMMEVNDKFTFDPETEAKEVYRTTDTEHPGVAMLHEMPPVLLGGPVTAINLPVHEPIFQKYLLTPRESRYFFNYKGWERIVAFQTRNPIHRAHEYLQKCALEMVDALLIHPLVGETKAGDIPADVRMECYEVLIDKYFPMERAYLSVFPAAMRYAGPREAIFHAICRKNYGCTHFIVGRDHAGVGNYYGTYDAQKIFSEFEPGEIGITPIFFDYTFYCRACGHMASDKTCPHDTGDHVFLSGTKVREMLKDGKDLPDEFTRPEISQILMEAYRTMEF
ncbi:MAG TPA: sulfate adenylyltransferase [Acidobacteriota bacterium]|nr:sulfate adenylyltransferase [Acidobacteriota bacterium]